MGLKAGLIFGRLFGRIVVRKEHRKLCKTHIFLCNHRMEGVPGPVGFQALVEGLNALKISSKDLTRRIRLREGSSLPT